MYVMSETELFLRTNNGMLSYEFNIKFDIANIIMGNINAYPDLKNAVAL